MISNNHRELISGLVLDGMFLGCLNPLEVLVSWSQLWAFGGHDLGPLVIVFGAFSPWSHYRCIVFYRPVKQTNSGCLVEKSTFFGLLLLLSGGIHFPLDRAQIFFKHFTLNVKKQEGGNLFCNCILLRVHNKVALFANTF
jgi:hypothetical protein